jgi:hypothetical protein
MSALRTAGGIIHRHPDRTTTHHFTPSGITTTTTRTAPTTGATMRHPDDLYALAATLFDPDGEPTPAPRDDDQPIAA